MRRKCTQAVARDLATVYGRNMGEPTEPKVTYDSTPWHVCPVSGRSEALRFKGGPREGNVVECPTCGQRLVYRRPKPSATPADQGGRTHF